MSVNTFNGLCMLVNPSLSQLIEYKARCNESRAIRGVIQLGARS